MNRIRLRTLLLFFSCFISIKSFAADDNIKLAVFANEAIVATYTYNYLDFLQRQKEIATYFSAEGWINYTKALNQAKLPEVVKKNFYFVSAVALLPPTIKELDKHKWLAKMPLLVVYKNPKYQQKQTLDISLTFTDATGYNLGARGFAITSLKAVITKDPCRCEHTEPNKAIV